MRDTVLDQFREDYLSNILMDRMNKIDDVVQLRSVSHERSVEDGHRDDGCG